MRKSTQIRAGVSRSRVKTAAEVIVKIRRERRRYALTPEGVTLAKERLFTFRVSAVAAEVAAGGVLELAFALRALADERGHLIVDVVGDLDRLHFAQLPLGRGQVLEATVDDEEAFRNGLLG